MSRILNYGMFRESKSNEIRVSCAGLASIQIDDKYLLVQNAKLRDNGYLRYGPLGGALEYEAESQKFLNRFVLEYERKTPDLRFKTTEDVIPDFSDWYHKRVGREISSKREIIEELVDEEKLLEILRLDNIFEKFRGIVRDRSVKSDIRGEVITERFFDIYDVHFDKWTMDRLGELAIRDETTIGLFTKEEILNDDMITHHSRFILRS